MTASDDPTSKHEKSFAVSADYLVLPVKNEGKGGKLKLYVENQLILDYDVVFGSSKADTDWYAFFSLERFTGKNARVVATGATAGGFDLVRQSDTIPGEENFYTESLRPRFHFTSRTGWLNDPNGLIYYKGEYHLFYQHNPTALPWGNMTWGHAVSTDMVHWMEQPKVLFPDAKTGTCFSGAMFIDTNNQLDRKTGDDDVLVAFYLRTEIGLCMAYSNDCGRTFTDYEDNPVLDHEGERIDTPRPLWHAPTNRWIAPTYDFFTNSEGELRRCVGFYSSENLTDWVYESRVEQDGWGDELCGCVDFFEMAVDGDPQNMKWVMILIDGSYIVGDFDGHTFRTLSGKQAVTDDRVGSLVLQGEYYATMTWHNAPGSRRVQVTWMATSAADPYPGMPFNQQMTVPSELTLHATSDGPRLRMNPIKELETLRTGTREWTDLVLNANDNPLSDVKGHLFDLEIEFQPGSGTCTVIELRGFKVTYDADSRELASCGTATKLEPADGLMRLRILLDRTSIEVYGNDGLVYIPHVVLPADDDLSLKLTATGGKVEVNHLRIHELQSSWV